MKSHATSHQPQAGGMNYCLRARENELLPAARCHRYSDDKFRIQNYIVFLPIALGMVWFRLGSRT